MFIKKAIVIALFCSISIAQAGDYQANNYSAWKVTGASEKDKYIEVISMDKIKPEQLNPICLSGNKMIFKYEMMGHGDSFYDKSAKVIPVKSINKITYRSTVFALKIDIEEDNELDGDLDKQYNKICADNKSQRYISNMRSKSGMYHHGVIKYIGDATTQPPF
jgi:hypothetical protein